MVGGEQPGLNAVTGVQVVNTGRCLPLNLRMTHGFAGFLSSVPKDLMYAISCSTCSSLICPWNVGMIGEYPATILAPGFRIDSRTYASSATTVRPSCSLTG